MRQSSPRLAIVYYPGIEYLAELVHSSYFTGIFGGKQLGRLSFDTRTPEVEPAPIPGMEKKLSDKVITMDMERRGDSPCLRLIERKSRSVSP